MRGTRKSQDRGSNTNHLCPLPLHWKSQFPQNIVLLGNGFHRETNHSTATVMSVLIQQDFLRDNDKRRGMQVKKGSFRGREQCNASGGMNTDAGDLPVTARGTPAAWKDVWDRFHSQAPVLLTSWSWTCSLSVESVIQFLELRCLSPMEYRNNNLVLF